MESKYNNNNYANNASSPKNYDISSRNRSSMSAEVSKVKDFSPQSSINTTYQSPSYRQSTPKGKPSIPSPSGLLNGSLPRSSSASVRRSLSPVRQRSLSPTKLHLSGGSISPRQLSDVDTDTIQKQRRELQLLIMELKDRDRELNDMVQTHQKQLHAWDEDRQRILALERRCARLEGELKSRNEQCKALTARLKSTEAEENSKRKELETTMERLKEVTEQAEMASHQVRDLEDKNSNLSDSLRELSNNFGQLQAKEQELLTKLQLKDNDITEANIHLGELQQKTRRLDNALQEYQVLEKSLRAERDQHRDQLNATKNEVETLRGEMSKQFSDADDLQSELAQSKQEYLVLQKEIFLAGEREKRKDQLLELQKSKQERTDSELQNLRQICERQQRDLSYMQMHLQSNQEAFLKAETTRDDRDFEPGKVNSQHPEWLDMAIESTPSLNESLRSLSRPLDTQSRVNGLPQSSTKTTDNADIMRDFTGLHLGAPDYSFDQPISRLSDQTTRTPPLKQENDILGSSMSIGDSEQFFQLPPSSSNPFVTFGATDQLQTAAQSLVDHPPSTEKQQDEAAISPTSKLHQLLAESRQMVQNLEQTTIKTPPEGSVNGSQKISPRTNSSTPPNVD